MALDTNYYTTPKTDQKTLKKICCELPLVILNLLAILFFSKKEMVGSYNGLKALILL